MYVLQHAVSLEMIYCTASICTVAISSKAYVNVCSIYTANLNTIYLLALVDRNDSNSLLTKRNIAYYRSFLGYTVHGISWEISSNILTFRNIFLYNFVLFVLIEDCLL